MLMFVVLRMTIGWHFFKEGMSHYHDPEWTSASFLRQAKGPLADEFKSVLPDEYAWYRPSDADSKRPKGEPPVIQDRDLQGDEPGDETRPAWKQWADDVADMWERHRQTFSQYTALTAEQEQQSRAVLDQYRKDLEDYLASQSDAIDEHLRERRSWAQLAASESADDVPYQRRRVADKQRELQTESAGWQNEIAALQAEYHGALNKILKEEQRSADIQLGETTDLDRVDKIVTYGLIGVGACLLVGLFTRTACVLGALFLASVVAMQPPWVAGTAPTYNQVVEMVALLALATTAVGRWAGLDFFIHHLIFWPFRAAKGNRA